MSLVLDDNIKRIFTGSGVEIFKVVSNDGTVLWQSYIGTVTNFAYTGGVQTFTAPMTGIYQLEVYGAQGGNYGSASGGKGGYSKGNISLSKGDVLYIVCGGQGSSGTTNGGTANGGYNGGGTGYDSPTDDYYRSYAGGGGATHIAKRTGILSSLANYKSDILIVAGGGGGVGGDPHNGGTGGGTTGGSGSGSTVYGSTGGTQTSGGSANYGSTCDSAFGKGANAASSGFLGSGGGGGGYYGGGTNHYSSGSGGSGYIGGVTDGSTENGQQSGNGKAKITFIGFPETITVTYIIEGKTYTEEKAVGTSCLNPTSFTIPSKSGYVFYGWSYTDGGDVLNDCTAGDSNITLYAVYGPYVYSATYTWSNVVDQPSRNVSINNTTYVGTATYIWQKTGGSTDTDQSADSGNVNIVSLTSTAVSKYKYADITFEIHNAARYGSSYTYIDGTMINEATTDGDGTNLNPITKKVTLTLSSKTSCTGRIYVIDNSSSDAYWSTGFIGVKSIVLHN